MSDYYPKRRLTIGQTTTGEFISVAPVELNDADAEEVCRLLKLDQNSPEGATLIEEFENAITIFMVGRKKGRPDTIGSIKRYLTKIKKAEGHAKELLRELSPSAQQHLNITLQLLKNKDRDSSDTQRQRIEYMSTGPTLFSLLSEDLEIHRNRLLDAIDYFTKHTNTDSGGHPVNDADRLLAVAVAHAMRNATGKPPAASRGGSFDKLLRVALRISGVGNWEDKSLHALVLWAAKGQKPAS